MNNAPATRLSSRTQSLAKPNPITGVDGCIQGIEAHAYLTYENATKDDLEKMTLKECLDNLSYGHTIQLLFEHNKRAVLGQWTRLFRSSEQPFERLRDKRLLLDGVASFYPADQIADKNLYHKVQDDIRRGAVLRVSIGARNTSSRKVINEISLVVTGKEPLAKMYKLLFSSETGKKEARIRSDLQEQIMATENNASHDALRRLIEKAGGEDQLVKIIETQTAFVENEVKKYGERTARDMKTHKQRLLEAFPENDYAKPLLAFYESALKDPSTEPILGALGKMMEDVEKLHKAKSGLEAAEKAKTEEWSATTSKIQAEFESTKAELAKAQEQITRFQGSAQDAAKGKRPSSEIVKPSAPTQTPVAQPAMPWTQSLQAIEVKQTSPFVADLWGNNRHGSAKQSAEIFEASIQEFMAKMAK